MKSFNYNSQLNVIFEWSSMKFPFSNPPTLACYYIVILYLRNRSMGLSILQCNKKGRVSGESSRTRDKI